MTRSKARARGRRDEKKRERKGAPAGVEERISDVRLQKVRSSLALQLSLDPDVGGVRYVPTLPLFDRTVPVHMLVAEKIGGALAFDIVDLRRERDLDEDGLLLLALERHGIGLAEIDTATIESEPRASNCRKIWRHREKHIEASLVHAVDHAVADGRALTVGALGRVVGLRYPLSTVCALLYHGLLQTDLGKQRFDIHSVVRARPGKPTAFLEADDHPSQLASLFE